jgi:hypothetical protein
VHQLEEVDAAHVFRRFPPSRDVCIQSSRPPLCCNPLRRFGCARSQGKRDICCIPRSASFRRCLAILPRRTTLRCAPRTPMSSTASSALTLTMGHKRRPLMTLGSSRSIVSFGSSIISQMLAVTSIPRSILAISVSLPVRRNYHGGLLVHTPMFLPAVIFVEGYSTVILSSVPPPLSTPIGCLDLCSALQIATTTMPSTLPHWHRRCLNPLSLPPSRPGRHRLVPAVPPAVPPAVLALLQLSTYSRLLPSLWLRQSILDDADKM